MARIRSVHPSLFTDEAWVSCSPLARLLYVGLWTDADDQGLFEWKPLQIKMRLLPGDTADVATLLGELADVELIASFEHGGKRFGAIKLFRKYQRPKKPNSVHFLPEEWRTYVALDHVGSEPDNDDGSPVPNRFPTSGENAPQMEDGGGRGGEEVSEANASSVADGDGASGFDDLWKAYPHVKGRSSKPKALDAWSGLALEVRQSLAGAAARYAVGGTLPQGGAPALAKWLADELWRDWLTAQADPQPATPAQLWPGPDDVRAAFAKEMGEPWTRAYIDPAGWQDVPERALVPATGTAGRKIVGEARRVLSAQKLTVLEKAA